jgi:hypothetical protein
MRDDDARAGAGASTGSHAGTIWGMVRPNSSISVGALSGSDATDRLRETIVEFNETATRRTDQLVRLTRWLVVLTVLLFAGLAVQIVLAAVD